jgi:hypothetical protein
MSMRWLFPIAGLTIIAVITATALGPTVGADTRVEVLAAEDPVLNLPISPNIDRVVADLEVELQRLAAAEPDPRIAEALLRISDNDSTLRGVATTPVDMFDSGRAAATATPVYDIEIKPDLVTVVVTTVELVPAYGATAVSRDHEDGHALINRSVARRCADDALADGVHSGLRGNSLIRHMMAFISREADAVHSEYHNSLSGASYGTHQRIAERALAEVSPCT